MGTLSFLTRFEIALYADIERLVGQVLLFLIARSLLNENDFAVVGNPARAVLRPGQEHDFERVGVAVGNIFVGRDGDIEDGDQLGRHHQMNLELPDIVALGSAALAPVNSTQIAKNEAASVFTIVSPAD